MHTRIKIKLQQTGKCTHSINVNKPFRPTQLNLKHTHKVKILYSHPLNVLTPSKYAHTQSIYTRTKENYSNHTHKMYTHQANIHTPSQ